MSVYEAIEAFAAEQGWVVKYSSDGTPNFFYPIYKCKSSDLDPSLPDHTHPAFIVNGAEIDRRLIAVYKGSSIVSGGAIHSLPMMAPAVSAGADALLSRIKQTGAGFGPKTVADSGLLLLLARKNDWVPHGNNAWSCDYRDVAAWDINANMTVGTKRGYHGYIWECISAHTSALENRPDISPKLWKRGKRVGGVPVASQIGSATSDEKYRGYNTLTGSGPASWRLDGTPSGIDDLNGNCYDQDYGYRIVDNELQILENNNAADPTADLSASSSAWRAILPNQGNNGFTLVTPGTSGTLHWNFLNNKITLDTVGADISGGIGQKGTLFKDLAVNTSNVPYVPYILQELGIFPISGDDTQGNTYHDFNGGERFPRRGGTYGFTSYAGLGYVNSYYTRGFSNVDYGVRSAYLE